MLLQKKKMNLTLFTLGECGQLLLMLKMSRPRWQLKKPIAMAGVMPNITIVEKTMEKISFWKKGKLIVKKIKADPLHPWESVKRYAASRGISQLYWSGICYIVL